MMEQNILLTHKEFTFLAAIAGIKTLYGFEVDTEEMERGDALLLIQGMVNKNYVIAEEGRMTLKEPMREMFANIGSAETIIDVHKKNGKKCIFYIGDCAIKVAPSLRRHERIEIRQMSSDDVWTMLKEEGWIR